MIFPRYLVLRVVFDQVRARVASGQYASESDVVAEALRTLEDRDRDLEQWLRTEAVLGFTLGT